MDLQEKFSIYSETMIREDQVEEELEEETPQHCFYTHDLSIKIQNINFPIKFPDKSVVLSLHLAYGFTFLVQVSYRKIQHYTSKGDLLNQFQFQKLITSIFMADSKTAILLLRSMNQDVDQLCQISLSTYQKISVPFITELKQLIGIQVFIKSKTFCIKQQSIKYQKTCLSPILVQKIKLTYFKYPLFEQIQPEKQVEIELKPIYISYFTPEQSTNYNILKLNNEFMIGIIKTAPVQDHKIDIHIHNPEKNQKTWKKYTLNSNISNIKKQKSSLLKIMNVWEYRPDTLYINCQVYPQIYTKINQFQLDEASLKQKMEKSYNLYWKYKNNDKKSVQYFSSKSTKTHLVYFIGQTINLVLAEQPKQYINQFRQMRAQIRQIRWGYNYRKIDGNILKEWIQSQPSSYQIPIHYINSSDKNSLSLVQKTKFRILEKNAKPNALDYKLTSVPYDNLKFLQYNQTQQQQSYTLNIKLKILRQLQYSYKIITAYFMTSIIEKLDQDLLYYMTEMLCSNENQIFYHNIE